MTNEWKQNENTMTLFYSYINDNMIKMEYHFEKSNLKWHLYNMKTYFVIVAEIHISLPNCLAPHILKPDHPTPQSESILTNNQTP